MMIIGIDCPLAEAICGLAEARLSLLYQFLRSDLFVSMDLVCFGLPVDSLSYEDTAGSPRNDGDLVGCSRALGLWFRVFNAL
jgi:hypothetical protein